MAVYDGRVSKTINNITKEKNDGFFIGCDRLPITSSYKYLGLEIKDKHQNLFDSAVENLVQRATAKIMMLNTNLNFHATDVQTASSLYNIFVRPIVEYGCQVWAPLINNSTVKKIERQFCLFIAAKLTIKNNSVPYNQLRNSTVFAETTLPPPFLHRGGEPQGPGVQLLLPPL
jgi:hypothetical protein